MIGGKGAVRKEGRQSQEPRGKGEDGNKGREISVGRKCSPRGKLAGNHREVLAGERGT